MSVGQDVFERASVSTNGNSPAAASQPVTMWPTLAPAALHGVAGEYALAADPYTEADTAGVLVSVLGGASAVLGRGPHMRAGNQRHTTAIWPVLVGDSAKGGKGTAYRVAEAALQHVDPDFFEGPHSRVCNGFGSGEALIKRIRDADEEGNNEAPDKRLFVIEEEYASVLNKARSDRSILSSVMRKGWDGTRLENHSLGTGTLVASKYHLVVYGHITTAELRMALSETEAFNGFANRFLWIAVRRSKRLPRGGNVPPELSEKFGLTIRDSLSERRAVSIERSVRAEERWAEIYNLLGDDDPPGLLGAVLARAEPTVLRLSLLYALLDASRLIDVQHVEAAYALWQYSRKTAERIWGDAIGNPDADKLYSALKVQRSLTGTEQHRLFGGHAGKERLDKARELLVGAGYAEVVTEETGGRPAQYLVLCERSEER